jgi:hypothetical protein
MTFLSSLLYQSNRTNSLGKTPLLIEQTSQDDLLASRDTFFQVPFAALTFNAEGQENSSRFFSRKIHFPGGAASGVTIGRGYDLGNRTATQIKSDLLESGAASNDALFFASAAGLRGEQAAAFVRANRQHAPEITPQVQYNLFTKVLIPYYIGDIKRIFDKDDVVEKYGEATWDDLPLTVQSILFDLRYRGDYSGETRRRLQPALVANDTVAFMKIIRDEEYWIARGVPSGRVSARIAASYQE